MYPTILVLALASPSIGVPIPWFFRLPADHLPSAVESKRAILAGWHKLTPIYRDSIVNPLRIKPRFAFLEFGRAGHGFANVAVSG